MLVVTNSALFLLQPQLTFFVAYFQCQETFRSVLCKRRHVWTCLKEASAKNSVTFFHIALSCSVSSGASQADIGFVLSTLLCSISNEQTHSAVLFTSVFFHERLFAFGLIFRIGHTSSKVFSATEHLSFRRR